MKKLIITVGIASLVALSSHAQGFVIFSSSTQNISTNNVAGAQQAAGQVASGKTLGAGNFYYALFYSTTISSGAALQGTASLSSYAFNTVGWTLDTDASAVSASTATAGRFASTAPNGDGSTTVTGLAGGNVANFVVVGWSANLGTTLAQAEAALTTPGSSGYIGESAVSGSITAGNGSSIPNTGLFGGTAPQIQGFTVGSFVVPTPEPGTLALCALGGASMLLFRRKK